LISIWSVVKNSAPSLQGPLIFVGPVAIQKQFIEAIQ
jgi:hypothetical protein